MTTNPPAKPGSGYLVLTFPLAILMLMFSIFLLAILVPFTLLCDCIEKARWPESWRRFSQSVDNAMNWWWSHTLGRFLGD